jgi:hypothetical protein
LHSCLSLLIPKSMSKGISQCISAVNMLYFGWFNPFSLNPSLPFPIIRQLSVHVIMSSICTDVKYFSTVDYQSLFLTLLPWVSWCSSNIAIFCLLTCIRSCLFLYICLSFGPIFCLWQKTCSFCLSEPGLLHYHDVLHFHPFTFKPHSFILSYGWIKLHCTYEYICTWIHMYSWIHVYICS